MNARMVILLAAACIGSASFETSAMYIQFETRQVPIDRLFANLQKQLAKDSNNFELTYDLARLHSMAYSTNLGTIAVRTNASRPQFYDPEVGRPQFHDRHPGDDSGVPRMVYPRQSPVAWAEALQHLTNAILLYQRAIVLLKTSSNSIPSQEWLVLPLELGYAWCLDQAGRRTDALSAYRKALALAWKREVTGNFSFKEWVQEKWDAVKSGNSPFQEATLRGHIGPGVCFSQEIIKYMLNLLHPVGDAKEIADLKDRQKTLSKVGRAITPILMPLARGAQLNELVDANAAVTFDLDGSGLPRKWGWITPKAAWLVYDHDGQGRITSALQMFGNVTFWIFWRDGYAALSSLDDDHDGTLRGAELRGIALWHDKNGNGVSEPGEVRAVSDWGIAIISCVGESDSTGILWCPAGVTFANGETRPTYDWIAPARSKPE